MAAPLTTKPGSTVANSKAQAGGAVGGSALTSVLGSLLGGGGGGGGGDSSKKKPKMPRATGGNFISTVRSKSVEAKPVKSLTGFGAAMRKRIIG